MKTRQMLMENSRAGEPRQSDSVSHYEFGDMPSQEQAALIEHRSTGAQPFRCPEDVYATAAYALGRADRPLKFEALHQTVSARFKSPVPAYQLRLCLRFWCFLGLASHQRARVVAEDGRSFSDAANAALAKLQKRALFVGHSAAGKKMTR